MARYRGPRDKLSRREGEKLFLKAERDFTDKSGFDRRPYPPGQHGHKRIRISDYARQLREKQKVKRIYGVLERQFRRYVQQAQKRTTGAGEALLQQLETRLDNVVFRMGFAGNLSQARQLVAHRHVRVNGRRVKTPSIQLKPGDEVELQAESRELLPVRRSVELAGRNPPPGWLEVNRKERRGRVLRLPGRNEIPVSADERLVLEYYAR